MDVSQDVIIREEDCGTEGYLDVPVKLDDLQPNRSSVIGRVLAGDVKFGK